MLPGPFVFPIRSPGVILPGFVLTGLVVPSILPLASWTGSPRATILSTHISRLLPAWDHGIPGCPSCLPWPEPSLRPSPAPRQVRDRTGISTVGSVSGQVSGIFSLRSWPVPFRPSPEQAGHGCHATGPLDRTLADDSLSSQGIDGAGPLASAADVLEQARALLAGREYQKAATILEDAAARSSSERPRRHDCPASPVLSKPGQSGRGRRQDARGRGVPRDAGDSRARLGNPGSRHTKARARHAGRRGSRCGQGFGNQSGALARPSSFASFVRNPRSRLFAEPSPLPEPGATPPLEGPERSVPAPAPASEPKIREKAPAPKLTPAATASLDLAGPASTAGAKPTAVPGRSADEESTLNQADHLFTDKKYEEAGRIYARLAGQNQLPAQRRQVWAYCRWVAVVARINAHPRSDREWDEIEQEISSIQRLTPGNWYGEYLQNRVAEARRAAHAPSRAGRLVVRGSAPDENPLGADTPRFLSRARSAPATPQAEASPAQAKQDLGLPSVPAAPDAQPPPVAPPSGTGPEAAGTPAQRRSPEGATGTVSEPRSQDQRGISTTEGNHSQPLAWHVLETANFRIYHADASLAAQAGKAAESVRSQQARRWGSSATRSTWSPRCDIYLYPTPRDFAQMTGQPETSPGFSTMGVNGNRIISRRVNLRVDHPQLLAAILPHEVTHVVLADLFTQQQIPRWADEGMAVLAEPLSEQLSRAADLSGPLAEGRVFKLNELMAIDYPSAEAWGLYYAQSVSVTQFLVEQGTPEQFISFVRGAQRQGIEQALREVYRIGGFAELENRWQNFARRQAATITASNRDPASEIDSSRRQ